MKTLKQRLDENFNEAKGNTANDTRFDAVVSFVNRKENYVPTAYTAIINWANINSTQAEKVDFVKSLNGSFENLNILDKYKSFKGLPSWEELRKIKN